jgi:hypothetical protein
MLDQMRLFFDLKQKRIVPVCGINLAVRGVGVPSFELADDLLGLIEGIQPVRPEAMTKNRVLIRSSVEISLAAETSK